MHNVSNNVQQTLDLTLEIKKEKEALAEKVLDAIAKSSAVLKTNTGDQAAQVAQSKATLLSLQGKASLEQLPLIHQALSALDNQLTTTESKEPTTRSILKQMHIAQATHTEVITTPATKKVAATAGASVKTALATALPQPNLPPSQSPDYPVLPNGPAWQLQDPYGATKAFIEYIDNHPTDPTARMNFMNFIISLTENGKLTPDIDQLLKDADVIGDPGQDNGGINMWANQMTQYAYFAGYQTGNGSAAMNAFLTDEITTLQNLPVQNDYTKEMIRCMGLRFNDEQNFTANHTNAAGDLTWTNGDGVTFDWTNPVGTDDQNTILGYINGQANADGTPNSAITGLDLNSMERDYRMSMLSQLLAQFKNYPLMAITMWLMEAEDTQTEAKVSGENESTDILTKATNTYADNITDALTAFGAGTGTTADTMKLTQAIFGAKEFFDENPQLSGVQSQFAQNIYQGLMSIPSQSGTLGDVFKETWANPSDPGVLQSATDALNKVLSGAGSTTPNPNFQVATNLTNQMSSLTTGQSKTVSTEQANDVSTIAAIIKTADAVLSMQKMFNKVIAHFND